MIFDLLEQERAETVRELTDRDRLHREQVALLIERVDAAECRAEAAEARADRVEQRLDQILQHLLDRTIQKQPWWRLWWR